MRSSKFFGPAMAKCALLAGVLCMRVGAARAQDAQITFYGGGGLLGALMPVSKDVPFEGAIFEGQDRLAYFRYGLFLTLRTAPGTYVYSASLSNKHPAPNSQLQLTVTAGAHYYVRVTREDRNLTFHLNRGVLAEVACDVARKEADRMAPLERKYVAPAMTGRVLIETVFPACP